MPTHTPYLTHDLFPLKDLKVISCAYLYLYTAVGCQGYHYVVEELLSYLTSLFQMQNEELMAQLSE